MGVADIVGEDNMYLTLPTAVAACWAIVSGMRPPGRAGRWVTFTTPAPAVVQLHWVNAADSRLRSAPPCSPRGSPGQLRRRLPPLPYAILSGIVGMAALFAGVFAVFPMQDSPRYMFDVCGCRRIDRWWPC